MLLRILASMILIQVPLMPIGTDPLLWGRFQSSMILIDTLVEVVLSPVKSKHEQLCEQHCLNCWRYWWCCYCYCFHYCCYYYYSYCYGATTPTINCSIMLAKFPHIVVRLNASRSIYILCGILYMYYKWSDLKHLSHRSVVPCVMHVSWSKMYTYWPRDSTFQMCLSL